jgi:nitrite reductase (NO-forming)/hydroxylamine reductase
MNKINLKNVFAVTLRDTGELALIDGDTKQIWQILKTGYAVHISRLSASGRYVYTVGRDGLVTLIDMWFEKPTTVADREDRLRRALGRYLQVQGLRGQVR